ncbi:Uu.00g129650.m01.CDS01 [Anthostomella pinea]|uniref:Uu.00g129650.m01.CDS01 n=1 Tax=Anthostomella pinea TaxID=933095 RepID=A0AAI8VJ54_9PEZI|nr:Uu.00g129650.m01.CDS01 [Anthostomella pinea]
MSPSSHHASSPLPGNQQHKRVLELDDDDLSDLSAALKGLARGSYPRLDAVPVALNAYAYRAHRSDARSQPRAYFHSITTVAAQNSRSNALPVMELDNPVLYDLDRQWHPIRYAAAPSLIQDPASYRFVCFIHKHRIDLRSSRQKAIYTISIWDREWDELTWHDTYPLCREARRDEIRTFWRTVAMPGFPLGHPRQEFMDRIRYRTGYHACERVEHMIRDNIAPRHTLWSVMAIAIHHMNNTHDPQVSIVPDKLELFGGQAKELLPQFFAHVLWMCLDARPDWSEDRQRRFVAQFKILERLRWMKVRTRKYLERRVSPDGGGDGGSPEWVFECLRI